MPQIPAAVWKGVAVFALSGLAGLAGLLPPPWGDLARGISTLGLGALALKKGEAPNGPSAKQ